MSARKSKSDVSATESAGPKRLTKRLSHPQPSRGRTTVVRWAPGADTDGHNFRLTDVRLVEATGGTGEIESVFIGTESRTQMVPRWGGDAICWHFEMISVEIVNVGNPSRYVIELEGEVVVEVAK
jgi:hypothetical protein